MIPQTTKMTKEDATNKSSERENVAAASSSDNNTSKETENKSNEATNTNTDTNTNAEGNGAQSSANKSESDSPKPQGIQISEDTLDADEQELIRRMRADAIDNTMYSKKFILQTMMSLSKHSETSALEKQLETDLCKLWDISATPEVVTFLLQNDIIELITAAISISEDVRLYEILIGLLGNMCVKVECVEQLTASPEWVEMLIKLTTCMDTCMLLQLMRLFQHVMVHVVSGKEKLAIDWYNCFAACETTAQNLGFILTQSVSDELLKAALKATNSILASCALVEEENAQSNLVLQPFATVFLKQELCDGVNNAFARLMRDDLAKQAEQAGYQAIAEAGGNGDGEESNDVPNSPIINCDIEVIQTYLNICTILVQLPEAQASMDLYASNIMYCLSRILIFLQQPMQLLPLGERQEEYLEDMVHICSCLKYYYDKATFVHILNVWLMLRAHVENYVEYDENDFDAYEDEPRSQYEENAFKLLRLLGHMVIQVDASVIMTDIVEIDVNQVKLFHNALQANQVKDAMLQRAHQRLTAVLNSAAGQAKYSQQD